LVLANLDCVNRVKIEWDKFKFPCEEAFDLLSERCVTISGSLELSPGEVRCLCEKFSPPAVRNELPEEGAEKSVLFKFQFPRDASRELVVPENECVQFYSSTSFRLKLIDPKSGKTVRIAKSHPEKCSVKIVAPEYRGDGTRCRAFDLEVSLYKDGREERIVSRFLVPPPAHRAKMAVSLGTEALSIDPDCRTVLSDGSRAAAQVRIKWADVRSQYDAFLAANPDPERPTDRISLWARTRCWLQREGYVREFDSRCLKRFEADPAGRFAKWYFQMPCGMGFEVDFEFTLSLPNGANAAELTVKRMPGKEANGAGRVRLVFRPDIEWRSFHSVTKAYRDDTEGLFIRSVSVIGEEGFDFDPYSRGKFSMRIKNGVYHHEPRWVYNVAHDEDAERQQEPCGDLFSPGWVSADLDVGEEAILSGSFAADGKVKYSPSKGDTPIAKRPNTLTLREGLKEALSLYIVRRDGLKTVIAGYPWFLDWGRDTFIVMRGMIAAGMLDDSLQILKAFAAFEEKGTLPNIIHGKTAGNRDTTDAPLWFVRCVEELGAKATSQSMKKALAKLIPVSESIVDGYMAGTSNGIRVDRESLLVWSPSHFTWMDTNYPACTPRCGYPVEIQALWISALRFLGRKEEAEKALASLKRLFKAKVGYCDLLDAPMGESAENAVRDESVRPNQLFLLSLGILDDESILDATGELLVPGGIRSLSSESPLYKGSYTGDEDSSRKRAYHNGTVWAWPFPMYAEGLVAAKRCSKSVALSLLGGAVENLNRGALCHISEIADGDLPHAQKGCRAQAWSESELLRVWLALGVK
jgi:predicted glycogen debranching enzyme